MTVEGEYTRFLIQITGKRGVVESRQDVVHSQGGSTAGIIRDPVVNDLHLKNTGCSGTVGGAAADF